MSRKVEISIKVYHEPREENMFLELTQNPGKYAGKLIAAILEGEARNKQRRKRK